MICADFEGIVEDVAAGERALDAALAAHVAACPRCEAALGLARRIETLLLASPPPPPDAFTAGVLRLVHRERWRSEQTVDRVFNVALVLGVVLVAAGGWVIAHAGGLAIALGDWLPRLTSRAVSMPTPGPHTWAYALSVMLLVSAAATWWWIEREGFDR